MESQHNELYTKGDDNHLEIFTLIWLDSNINIQHDQHMQEKLRTVINRIKKFNNPHECKSYIEQTLNDDRFVLIVNGELSRQLLLSIHQLRQVTAIYINSYDKKNDEKWTSGFSKVRLLPENSILFYQLL